MYVRILTALENTPPSALDASFNGTEVNLTWQNELSPPAQLKRVPDSTMWVQSTGSESFDDTTWEYSTTYMYWARHYNSPEWTENKARVTGWSDSVEVTIPDSLTAYISGRDTVPDEEVCAWTGIVEGGTGPHSYDWSGDVEDSTQVINESFSLGESPVELIFTGSDSLGWQAVDTFEVIVDKFMPPGQCQLGPSPA